MKPDPTELFEHERPRLLRLAYRMLGSHRDAEDVVQDAWLRWAAQTHETVLSPSAYLSTTVSRACLDMLRSAHVRRVDYVGEWLPEPILGDSFERYVHDAEARFDVAEDVSLALMRLLERLNPVERAVFVLRESLDFSYAEIAAVVERSEEHCRQIERRARQRLGDPTRAQTVPADARQRLLAQFLGAVRDGDVEGLVSLLAADCVSIAEGGGRSGVAREPVVGSDRVSRYLMGLARKAPPDTRWEVGEVNGAPGIFTYVNDQLHNVIAFDMESDRIRQLFIIVNPAKLGAQR
jgi:RNA polymerase sigma-70 factor (ECF subfamily)